MERTAPWNWMLVLPGLVCFGLLIASQGVFLETSFRRDLGFGDLAPDLSLENYTRVLGDPFYLRILGLSVQVAGAAASISILVGWPLAYLLSRMNGRVAMALIAAILLTSFITIVIKIYGLIVLFSGQGWINQSLLALGLINRPITPIGTVPGVILGLIYFSFGFGVMLLYGVLRTIPRSLEDAAAIHGAPRWRVLWRVVLPLSLPGLTVAFLTMFNLGMGAFTSAALLGGGQVLTLPVLIQRSVLMEVKYGVGGVLAALLMVATLAINLASILIVRRLPGARRAVA